MNRPTRRTILAAVPATLAFGGPLLTAWPARAKNYGPGVSDSEIKIGNTGPYSGPLSNASPIPLSMAAYFKKINAEGGINGRKINFISDDDGYSPPKTVEMTRKLVESDKVLFLAGSVGTPTNSAVWHYLNQNKVPQLFPATGATKWDDPKGHPWTMGFFVSYQAEGRIYASYILKEKPNAKIAVLYQNDDFGKDYLIGLKEGLGDKNAKMIVQEASYEVTDPTVDSQIVGLQSSGADTLLTAATPKFAAQAIRKVYDIGWKPLHFMTNVSISVASVMTPAGPEKGVGIITATYGKDPTDPRWKDDPGMKQWHAWMAKYYPDGDQNDASNVFGYGVAMTMVQVLKQCNGDFSRENVMKQAANLKNFEVPTLLPGIKINTSPTDYYPIQQMQLEKWDGKTWVLFGDVISGAGS